MAIAELKPAYLRRLEEAIGSYTPPVAAAPVEETPTPFVGPNQVLQEQKARLREDRVFIHRMGLRREIHGVVIATKLVKDQAGKPAIDARYSEVRVPGKPLAFGMRVSDGVRTVNYLFEVARDPGCNQILGVRSANEVIPIDPGDVRQREEAKEKIGRALAARAIDALEAKKAREAKEKANRLETVAANGKEEVMSSSKKVRRAAEDAAEVIRIRSRMISRVEGNRDLKKGGTVSIDNDFQMFVEAPGEYNLPRVKFLRWLAKKQHRDGNQDQPLIGQTVTYEALKNLGFDDDQILRLTEEGFIQEAVYQKDLYKR